MYLNKLKNLESKVLKMYFCRNLIIGLFVATTILINIVSMNTFASASSFDDNNVINTKTTSVSINDIDSPVELIANTHIPLMEAYMDITKNSIEKVVLDSVKYQLQDTKVEFSKPKPEPEYTTYAVQSGDNLWSLAYKFYGDGSKFYTLRDANQGIAITAGNTITIPTHSKPVETTTIPKITSKTDLCAPINITVEQMNTFIDGFGNTAFKGHGDIFIEAYAITGYNPLYLFGHAVLESSWGEGDLAKYKGNYFGIGAYDSDPYNCAYTMASADSGNNIMRDGIINGAIWIKENWYDRGLTSLYSMIYGTKYPYASAGDHWINSIVSLANQKLSLINV